MDRQFSHGSVAFGVFRLFIERRILLRLDAAGAWVPVAAGSRALDVLAVLLRKPGAVATKDTIIHQVWPSVAVEANNLTVQITGLRRLLDDSNVSASCIQTVPGRGYRFVAPVTHLSDDSAELVEGDAALTTSMPTRPEHAVPATALRDLKTPTATVAETDAALSQPSPSPERRQLTVLAFNMVGLAELSIRLGLEDLRELTTAWQQHCSEIIQLHQGTIANFTLDAALVYFGYPQADEHDAERAVRAGLALAEAMPKLRTLADTTMHARVGIATGLVVVAAPVGTSAGCTVTAVGNPVHLAAAMETLAAADQVVIAASTRRLIANAFELTDLGKHDLDAPTYAWRVERAVQTESRFDAQRGGAPLTPLVGRDEELDLLLRRWSQAQDGEGQVVLLSGDPGIGKSRIVNTLLERLEPQGVTAIRAQCLAHYVNSPLRPVIDNFERTLKFSRDETPESKLDKLEALIVTHYKRPVSDVRFVASILSIPCGQRYGPLQMTPRKNRDETLRALVDITAAAARRQPSVMLFEDAHWADPTMLELLDLLIDRVMTVPLLIVLTHRPEFKSRWSGHGHVGAISLSKLTRTQSAAMVSSLVGGKALPARLLEQILTKTDGLPLFVEELTKTLLESGQFSEADDRCVYSGAPATITLPGTLRDSLMARLDRCMPMREIAQIGATIGREFSHEMLAAIAPMPQVQLDDALARLTQSGLVFRRGTPPDAVYTFKHALVRDTAYDSLLKTRRQLLHAKIARAIEAHSPLILMLEPEVLAYHFTEAGLIEAAIPLWQKAGELALQRWALIDAASHFSQALNLVTKMPRSPEREAKELETRRALASAHSTYWGWAASTRLTTNPAPGCAPTRSLERPRALLPILFGLTIRRSRPGIYRRSDDGAPPGTPVRKGVWPA